MLPSGHHFTFIKIIQRLNFSFLPCRISKILQYLPKELFFTHFWRIRLGRHPNLIWIVSRQVGYTLFDAMMDVIQSLHQRARIESIMVHKILPP